MSRRTLDLLLVALVRAEVDLIVAVQAQRDQVRQPEVERDREAGGGGHGSGFCLLCRGETGEGRKE